MAFTPKTKMIAKPTGAITSAFATPSAYVQPKMANPNVVTAPITSAPTTTAKRDIRTAIPNFSTTPKKNYAISPELAIAIGVGGASLANYLKASAKQEYGSEAPMDYTSSLVPGSMEPGGPMSGPATGPGGPSNIPGGAPAGSGASGTSGTSGAASSKPSDIDKLGEALKAAIIGGATAVAIDKVFSAFGMATPPGATVKDKIGNVINSKAKQATGSAWDTVKSWFNSTPSTGGGNQIPTGEGISDQSTGGNQVPTGEGISDQSTGLPGDTSGSSQNLAGGDGTAMGETNGVTGSSAPYNPGDTASGYGPGLNPNDTGEPGFFGPGGPGNEGVPSDQDGSDGVDTGEVGKDGVPADEVAQEVLQQPQITALGDGYFYDETTAQVYKVEDGELVNATDEFSAIFDAGADDYADWGIDYGSDDYGGDFDYGENDFAGDSGYESNSPIEYAGNDVDYDTGDYDTGDYESEDIYAGDDDYDYDEYGAKGGLFTLKDHHMAHGGLAHMAKGGEPPPGSNTEYYADGSSVSRDVNGHIVLVVDENGENITQETIAAMIATQNGLENLTPLSVQEFENPSAAEQAINRDARVAYYKQPAEDPSNRDIAKPGSNTTVHNTPTGTPSTAGGNPATPPPPAKSPETNSFLQRIRNVLGNEYVQGGITAGLLAQILGNTSDKGNKGVDVGSYAIQGGRTTDFGMGPARTVSLGPAAAMDPVQQNMTYANLGVPGYTPQVENTVTPPATPATPTVAHGGSIHYTYGTRIDPHEMLGIPKRGGGLASMNGPSGVPMLQGRHDYRQGAYVQGAGDGQSDDIPAMLADGEYVIDAELVSMLGNGSNKAGAKVLDSFRQSVREHKRSAPIGKIPPKTKSPLQYLKGA